MIGSFKIPVRAGQVKLPAALLYLAYVIMAGLALHSYLSWQSVNVVLGIMAILVVTTVQRQHKTSSRFAWLALAAALLCVCLPVKTLLFFAIVFACFFVTETGIGKMNLLPVLVVGIMSPVFQFVSNVMSFPLRLWLTRLAGSMMNAVQLSTEVEGNLISYNGNEFAVDPACMGLNMLVVGLLLQLMVIAVFQKQYKATAPVWMVMALLGFCVVLNIVSNLFRIICLVYFNLMPGTVMHDVMGVVCLLVYVVLPMVIITRRAVKRAGNTRVTTAAGSLNRQVLMHTVLLLIISYCTLAVARANNKAQKITGPVQTITGFEASRVEANIIKLYNPQCLVYIKRIPGFYSADHNPGICWKGSGYDFKQVTHTSVNGQPVYTAVMENGQHKLYTAWWYDNGMVRTTSQFTWRWTTLKQGKDFSLVNVTTTDQQQLLQQVRQLLQHNRLTPVL